jgi:long-chain acyl-CoA synthetase
VTLLKNISTEEIVQYRRTQLTPYKLPKHIVVMHSLPKSSVEKILRKELRNA